MKNIDEEVFKQCIAKKVRKIRNTSQEMLAESAEISIDTISALERGKSIISSLTLVKLCNSLNVTPNDILNDFIDNNLIDNRLQEEISTLSTEEREFLLYIIEFVKRNKNRY